MVAMPERKRSRLLAGTFFFSIFFLLATSPAFSAETYRFERMWPSTPSSWFFRQPAYVATDSRGYIYVSDSMQIQKFTADGQLISKWLLAYSGGLGAITVAEDGSVFVAASQNGGEKILKLDASGNIIRSFGQYTTTVATAFKYPCGLAVDREGNVYAADSGNHRVQKFSPDGILITEWGTPGSGNGQFNEPAGIAVDRKNNFVYVMDTQNLRTQKFTTDGQYLTQWQSIDSGGRDPAMGISVDPQGNVYVRNTTNSQIRKFSPDGLLIDVLTHKDWGPYGMAIDPIGSIYIAHFHMGRIEKLSPDGDLHPAEDCGGTGAVDRRRRS